MIGCDPYSARGNEYIYIYIYIYIYLSMTYILDLHCVGVAQVCACQRCRLVCSCTLDSLDRFVSATSKSLKPEIPDTRNPKDPKRESLNPKPDSLRKPNPKSHARRPGCCAGGPGALSDLGRGPIPGWVAPANSDVRVRCSGAEAGFCFSNLNPKP